MSDSEEDSEDDYDESSADEEDDVASQATPAITGKGKKAPETGLVRHVSLDFWPVSSSIESRLILFLFFVSQQLKKKKKRQGKPRVVPEATCNIVMSIPYSVLSPATVSGFINSFFVQTHTHREEKPSKSILDNSQIRKRKA